MIRYVMRRILITIPVLMGVVFIVFTIMSLTPGDPATIILGTKATPEAVAELNHKLGYDRPFLVRFLSYVKSIVTKFDFGLSYRTQKPVIKDILVRFPYTLRIAVLGLLFSATVGMSLGILSAVRQYSFADNMLTVIAMFFAAIPSFWLGMMLTIGFALKLQWLPSSGLDSWASYVLPIATLTLTGSAGMLRMTRTQMLEAIRQDYIRTARAKGAPERTVIWKHALKNALLPLITSCGLSFGAMLGGTIIIETTFGMPGLGTYMLTNILAKDVPAVMSSTLFFSALFSLIMLVVDVLYAFIDPRIKAKYVQSR